MEGRPDQQRKGIARPGRGVEFPFRYGRCWSLPPALRRVRREVVDVDAPQPTKPAQKAEPSIEEVVDKWKAVRPVGLQYVVPVDALAPFGDEAAGSGDCNL